MSNKNIIERAGIARGKSMDWDDFSVPWNESSTKMRSEISPDAKNRLSRARSGWLGKRVNMIATMR